MPFKELTLPSGRIVQIELTEDGLWQKHVHHQGSAKCLVCAHEFDFFLHVDVDGVAEAVTCPMCHPVET